MSRTKRKDLYVDQLADRKTHMFFGEESGGMPSEKDKIRAHKDGKKWYKLGKTHKKLARQRDEAKPKNILRRALAQGKDLDNLILPDAKKHDRYDAT